MNYRQRAKAERVASDVGAIVESFHGLEISVFVVSEHAHSTPVIVVSRDKRYDGVYTEKMFASVDEAIQERHSWFSSDPAWTDFIKRHKENAT